MSRKYLKKQPIVRKNHKRRVNWWILGVLSIILVAAIATIVMQQNRNNIDPVAIAPINQPR